jgi:nicotinamide riboside kinase
VLFFIFAIILLFVKNNIKIVLIGPESSGKTTLGKDLAEYYKVDLADEFARDYLDKNGPDYSFEDVLKIAEGQLELDKLDYQIYDTDLFVLKVWIAEKYGKTIDWIEKSISQYQNRIYLLCHYDIPYETDNLREHPNLDDRKRLHLTYKTLLKSSNHPFLEVNGSESERIKKSVNFIGSISKL